MPCVKMKRTEPEEKIIKYVRRPIDYSALDDIGHGVKISANSFMRNISYTNSLSTSFNDLNQSLQNEGVPTPPLALKANIISCLKDNNGSSSVRSTHSSTSYYRAPIIPPSVPSDYLSRQELGIYSSKKELNQSGCAEYLSSTSFNSSMDFRRASDNSNGLAQEYSSSFIL